MGPPHQLIADIQQFKKNQSLRRWDGCAARRKNTKPRRSPQKLGRLRTRIQENSRIFAQSNLRLRGIKRRSIERGAERSDGPSRPIHDLATKHRVPICGNEERIFSNRQTLLKTVLVPGSKRASGLNAGFRPTSWGTETAKCWMTPSLKTKEEYRNSLS